MRSLVVTAWFPDDEVPSRTPFIVEHCWSLQEAGHEITVVHVVIGREQRPTRQEVYQAVPVTRVWLDVTSPLSYLRVVWTILRGLRAADVLHTMAYSAVLVTAPSWLLRRLPWVHTEHWGGIVHPANVGPMWRRFAWLRHILRLPHVVTGVTTHLATKMSPFTRPGATRVVPCVVESLRPVLPFPPAPPLRLVGVGAFNPGKNPLLALDTIAWLTERGVDVRYTMVGGGRLLERAQSHAQELGIADRVVFTGPILPERVFDELPKAHLFFLPSARENFFTAVAEAIASGRPAAVPLSGGFDDYCTEENSVLTDSWDTEALGAAILSAWDRFQDADPEAIASTVRSRFSRATVGRQFDALYREVAKAPLTHRRS